MRMKDTRLIDAAEALDLLGCDGADFFALMARAGAVRQKHKGNRVVLCGILNAKSGRCSEDCSFCAQSAHHSTDAPIHPLVSAERMVERAREVQTMGAREFSIVTSGETIRGENEMREICEALTRLRDAGAPWRCVSLGNLSEDQIARLRDAGLNNLHHNLETARSFFPKVCSTHEYDRDVQTVRTAKSLGLKVCCGGIFGLGESPAQRVELAMTLRELEVDSIPLNFLNPIPGTPLQGRHDLTPIDCLKIIAVYRLLMPDRDIYVCGGREVNLRDMQSWIFMAGANGMMIGNYLTTSGRDHALDLRMIQDAGMEVMPRGDAP
ncbi:MAG: biotin synthase BioB [Deltaproteobacteria bacterium]|nr:biotin synthase BioB [Deltaproteobacteria bacterium]